MLDYRSSAIQQGEFVVQQPTTLEELQDALSFISADTDRASWVRILMGIKNEFGDTARDIAERWSQSADSYNKANFTSTWNVSIKSGGKTTIATVFGAAIANGYQPRKKEYSAEEKAQFKKLQAKRAEERKKEQHLADEELKKWHLLISDLATTLFNEFTIKVKSNAYTSRKNVDVFGAKAFKQSIIIVVHDDLRTQIIDQADHIQSFFGALPKDKNERTFWFLHIKKGDLAIPLYGSDRIIWQLQIINKSGTKLFIKNGKKSGCFFIIGKPKKSNDIALTEGYATGASIYKATGIPVALAFDAANLIRVAESLKQLFPEKRFLICSDHDNEDCLEPKKAEDNPGIFYAIKAAHAINALVVIPQFPANDESNLKEVANG